MKFRYLRADEIEVRPALIKSNGVQLLLYKDARCDMNILDESGVKWQRLHGEHKGNLFCKVGIYDEDIKEWISDKAVKNPAALIYFSGGQS